MSCKATFTKKVFIWNKKVILAPGKNYDTFHDFMSTESVGFYSSKTGAQSTLLSSKINQICSY